MMKVKPVKLGKTERMSFSHIDEVISMPNLIEVQKNSYQWFLDEGLKEVFHDIGTIEAVSYTHLIFAVKPGDGSAREQAASCQRVLGAGANIVTEYATKRCLLYTSRCV